MFRHVVASLCMYELAAIYSRGKLPTLSTLSARHRVVGPLLVGGLVSHLVHHRRTTR
jgi:hypothetical protein